MKITIKLFLTIWTALLILSPSYGQEELSGEITIHSCAYSIQVLSSGGFPAYEYEWSGPTINNGNFYFETIENITPGQYCVTVSDMVCRNFEACVDITCTDLFSGDGCGIVVQDFGSNQFCGDAGTGFIDIEVFPSNGLYNYRWAKNGQLFSTDQDVNSITEGQYTVTVTTQTGCTLTESFDICCCFPDLIDILDWPFDVTQVPQIDNSLLCARNIELGNLLEGDVTHASGPNSQDGSIDLLIEESNTISFSWTLNGVDYPGNGPDLNNLNPGLYCIDMDYGCNGLISACFLVMDESCTDFDFVEGSNIDPQCGNEANGGIDITLNSAFEPYTFSWSIGSQNQDLSNLSTGDYCVTVTGSNGCTGSECFTVGSIIQADIQNSNVLHPTNASSGSIELELTGSVGQILWSNGDAGTTSITGLEPGNYCVTVTSDGNSNCAIVECFDLEQLCDIGDIPVTITESICGNGGSITLDIDPIAIISWRDENGMLVGDGPSITDLGPGQYCASISAVNNGGCIFCYDVADSGGEISNVQWTPVCGSEYELSFDGGELPLILTGYISVAGFGSTFNQNNTLITSNPFLIDLAGNPAEGILYYVLESSGDCSDTYYGTLDFDGFYEYNVSFPLHNINALCVTDYSPGSVTVFISGGTGPYDILWSNGDTGESISINETGEYCVTVTDFCGNTDSSCLFMQCQDFPTDVYGNNGCRLGGVGLHRDCPCIGDCNDFADFPFNLDLDGSEIESSHNWDNILGTVTITWPDGSITQFINGNGQQQIVGELNFDISEPGDYPVSIYADWLNQEVECIMTFTREYDYCGSLYGDISTGINIDVNSALAIGCYSANICAFSPEYVDYTNFNSGAFIQNGADVSFSLISYTPIDPDYPCTEGGYLTITCPCEDFGEIVIDIPPYPFSQFVNISDINLEDLDSDPTDGNDLQFPCSDPQGACIFDYFLIEGIPIIDSEVGDNPLLAFICPEEADPPEIDTTETGLCDDMGFMIPIEDEDECVFTYYCSDTGPDETFTIEGTGASFCKYYRYDEEREQEVCVAVEYCMFGTDCHIIGDPIADDEAWCNDISFDCPPCVVDRFGELPNQLFENLNAPEYKLFPNPANQIITLQRTTETGNSLPVVIQIFDSEGKLVKESSKVFQNKLEIILGNLSSGLYILKVIDFNGSETFKFIKHD